MQKQLTRSGTRPYGTSRVVLVLRVKTSLRLPGEQCSPGPPLCGLRPPGGGRSRRRFPRYPEFCWVSPHNPSTAETLNDRKHTFCCRKQAFRPCRLPVLLVPIHKRNVGTSRFPDQECAIFFISSRKSMDFAEAYDRYAAQGILPIDAEIMKKGHFWMETC